MESAIETEDARSATGASAAWLVDYLTSVGGTASAAKVKERPRSRKRPRVRDTRGHR